ncbi:MAG: DUF2282 domain-containing protein [Alphaproteobacteria bacterium]|nr:DUF2282 domain-containing protein [Alphaproteobacteria bacterium]
MLEKNYGLINAGKNGCPGKHPHPQPSTSTASKAVLCAALVGLMAVGAAGQAFAADNGMMAGKEKCYGIAKAGKNDCKSMTGSHSCAGMSTKDNDPNDFKMVNTGECAKDGGTIAAPTK